MATDEIIEGLHVVEVTAQGVWPPKPTTEYPYRLEVELDPPRFMDVLVAFLYRGTERIVVQGQTRAAIDALLARNDFPRHPRFRRYTLTGDGDPVVVTRVGAPIQVFR